MYPVERPLGATVEETATSVEEKVSMREIAVKRGDLEIKLLEATKETNTTTTTRLKRFAKYGGVGAVLSGPLWNPSGFKWACLSAYRWLVKVDSAIGVSERFEGTAKIIVGVLGG